MAVVLLCITVYGYVNDYPTQQLGLYLGLTALALVMFAIKRMQKKRSRRSSRFGNRRR